MQTRTHRFFAFTNRHARSVIAVGAILALVLGGLFSVVANTDDSSFDPEGEIYTLLDQADSTLVSDSTIAQATFLVEAADGGDVLTAAAFQEWKAASDLVRSNHAGNLVDRFDADLGSTIPGVMSLVDVVDQELPNGVDGADDADIKAALGAVLADGSPFADFRFTLSEQATTATAADGTTIWSSPAFTTSVVYDEARFDGSGDGSPAELWLRDVQADFQANEAVIDSTGVAIDFDTTFDEAIQASAPFIFLAVSLIVVLIAIVHRSYWSAAVVASGLGATMLVYNGVAGLVGLRMGSLLLSFIVPIALISFGVDFYIHGSGRVREMQVEGHDRTTAYPAGMTAVFTAMLLAVTTSVVAFLSNALSGTEAIVEFGMGAAIGLVAAYVMLGLLAPRVLLAIESSVGPNKVHGRIRWAYRAAMLPVAVVAGLAATLAAVQPAIGTPAVAISWLLVLVIPVALTRRRNRKAVAGGRPTDDTIRGAAHGLRAAGTVVHGVARWRMVTFPAALAIGGLSLFGATQVTSGFELKDFLPSTSAVVQSIDRIDQHFPSSGQGSSMIYLEGDLTQPATLVAIEAAVADIDASGADLGRDNEGGLIVGTNAVDVVRAVMATPTMVDAITESGTPLTDTNGDGLADTAAQTAAIYAYVTEHGVVSDAGDEIIAAEDIPETVALLDDGGQATAVTVSVGSFTDGEIIQPVWDALDEAAAGLSASTIGLTTVGVTGEVITQFDSLEAFSRSMLVSLPVAMALALVVAGLMLRSIRYAIASVVPIAFVVSGVYAFMFVAGYQINVVTATIAAIAVGVGIDFSTHFTARFREELRVDGNRLEALRRAGAGTGGALVLSAVTSVLGFTVMALAPTPIFAAFGVLTAVMIALALAASLLVLPSVLALLTPRAVPPQQTLPFDDVAIDVHREVTPV